MKSTVKIYDLGKEDDSLKIKSAISVLQGIIAYEVFLGKKEIQVVYNEDFVSLEKIIINIEDMGFIVT